MQVSAPSRREPWFAFRSVVERSPGSSGPTRRSDSGTTTEIREITGTCDALPPLPLAWRELVAFAAGYYQRGLGEIALSVLPTELRRLDNAAIANRLRPPRASA